MNRTLAKATPEQRAVPEPPASQASSPQVESARPDTELPALQAGAGNAALAAAAANGSLGTVSPLLLRQAIYGNGAAAQAAEAGEVGAETPQRRTAESVATNSTAVIDAGEIRPS